MSGLNDLGAEGQLVCLLVFKTSVGLERGPGWVRFPHVPAKKEKISDKKAMDFY